MCVRHSSQPRSIKTEQSQKQLEKRKPDIVEDPIMELAAQDYIVATDAGIVYIAKVEKILETTITLKFMRRAKHAPTVSTDDFNTKVKFIFTAEDDILDFETIQQNCYPKCFVAKLLPDLAYKMKRRCSSILVQKELVEKYRIEEPIKKTV